MRPLRPGRHDAAPAPSRTLAATRSAFRRADRAFVAMYTRGVELFTRIADSPSSTPPSTPPAAVGEHMAEVLRFGRLRARVARMWSEGFRALAAAECKRRRLDDYHALLGNADARAAVVRELGGDAALVSWERRDRAHRRHEAELAGIVAQGFGEADALAELRRRHAEAAPMPATLPPTVRARAMGEAPSVANGCIRERLVHPDTAHRLLVSRLRIRHGGKWGGRRDASGRFALAPVPRLVSVPRGRARTVLAVEPRHAVSIEEIRADVVAGLAEMRAEYDRKLAETPYHHDAQLEPPILLTPDELRRGLAAHTDARHTDANPRRNVRTRTPKPVHAPVPEKCPEECEAVGHDPPVQPPP